MGPCLWGTEYSAISLALLSSSQLQWGRAFGARNTTGFVSLINAVTKLQWGRAFGARNTGKSRSRGREKHRFNGAVPLGHGIRQIRRCGTLVPPKLQWGRAFGARNTSVHRRTAAGARRLQWGRAFGARNTASGLSGPLREDSFNGAVPLGHGIPINNQVGVVM